MPGVFISYHGDDTRHTARQLGATLSRRFGVDQVVLEGSHPSQARWPRVSSAISASDVVLALIGPNWVHLLEDARDSHSPIGSWLENQLLVAEEADTPVVPVLVDEAVLPADEERWPEISSLAALPPSLLRGDRYDEDIGLLERRLRADFEIRPVGGRFKHWNRAKKAAVLTASVLGFIATCVGLYQTFFEDDRANRPPVFVSGQRLEAVAGSTEWFELSNRISDKDGGELTIAVNGRSTEGALVSVSGPLEVSFTAPIGNFGPDEFVVTVIDEDGAPATGTIDVEVLAGPIEGALSIAIAELDAAGDAEEALVRTASEALFGAAQASITSDDPLAIALAGPERTGRVEGASLSAKRSNAEEVARRMLADIVVFGTLSTDGATEVTLGFYVDPRELAGADELVGAYEFEPIRLATAGDATMEVRMTERAGPAINSLAALLRGLGHYGANEYENAEVAFERASESWPTSTSSANGESVVWQLLGNVYGEQDRLDDATVAYETAIGLENEARAVFGLTEVQFLNAAGPACGRETPVDLDQLEEAIASFESILELREPALSFVHARSEVEIARVELCLTLYGDDRAERARQGLSSIIERYDNEPRLNDLIGEARSSLALYYTIRGQPALALAEYELAIASSADDGQLAFYYLARADILACELAQPELAELSYALSQDLEDEPITRRDCDA